MDIRGVAGQLKRETVVAGDHQNQTQYFSTMEECSCNAVPYVAEGDAKFEQIVSVEGFFL